ncbi:MAG TPA: hypothetical protein VFW96_08200 [Thermomicrobiales bacterium]|nr:hypothetical protein [Thermomicrobiales bacterium]
MDPWGRGTIVRGVFKERIVTMLGGPERFAELLDPGRASCHAVLPYAGRVASEAVRYATLVPSRRFHG